MFQKCSFCPTLQIRGLLERSHSSHPTTVRAVYERLIRHAQGSPSGSLSPRAIGLCRTFRNSTPLFITAVSTYKGRGEGAAQPLKHRVACFHPHPSLLPTRPALKGEGAKAVVNLTSSNNLHQCLNHQHYRLRDQSPWNHHYVAR